MPPRSKTLRPARKHVTTACIPCRDGKVKCDGDTPVCRNCRLKGRNCSYRQTDDKRKIPVRLAVSFLAQRVDQLSGYIRSLHLPSPKIDGSEYATVKNVLKALEVRCEDLISGADSSKTTGVADENASFHTSQDFGNSTVFMDESDLSALTQPAASNSPLVSSYAHRCDTNHLGTPAAPRDGVGAGPSRNTSKSQDNLGEDPIAVETPPPTEIASPQRSGESCANPVYTTLEQDSTRDEAMFQQPALPAGQDGTDSDSDDEVTDQVSCRLGRLQLTHDGQLRYFGSTSNLTLLDALVGINPPCTSPFQRDAQEILENANLTTEVDESFEKHLLELYFSWHDPWVHVVDMDSFWKARARFRYEGLATPYYSRALSDAMCALGAAHEPRYHPELVTFPRSLSEFFGDRARLLLELELESPTIATIQTLVVLSSHEAACTKDTRCWLYSGMAMRLAFDLGLHVDMSGYVEKGIIRAEEADLRRMIFWGVYLSEQFWGFYLGRSPQSPMSGVSVPKPGPQSTLPTTRWIPYPTGSMMESVSVPFGLIFCHWVSLYDLMLPLTDVLYGAAEISKHSLQQLTSRTVFNLRLWKTNLPSELDIDRMTGSQQPLPHIIALHMQYHQFMIHCHRPYISRHYIQPQPPQGPGPQHARHMCIESAVEIVKLLEIYEKSFTFRRANVQIISFIFSAALILIFTIVPSRPNPLHQELIKYLSTCFRALDDMGACFENSRRTSTFLGTLQRQWQIRRRNKMTKKAGYKRDNRQQSGTSHLSSSNAGESQWFQNSNGNNLSGPAAARQPSDSHLDYFTSGDFLPTDNSPSMDFMDLSLCNVLLSEGIPRAFV